jgi:hypothetical protein
MKTEEILSREAEYRVIREALGTYHLDLVTAWAAQARGPAAEGSGIAGHSIRLPDEADEASPCPDHPAWTEPTAGWEAEFPAAGP